MHARHRHEHTENSCGRGLVVPSGAAVSAEVRNRSEFVAVGGLRSPDRCFEVEINQIRQRRAQLERRALRRLGFGGLAFRGRFFIQIFGCVGHPDPIERKANIFNEYMLDAGDAGFQPERSRGEFHVHDTNNRSADSQPDTPALRPAPDLGRAQAQQDRPYRRAAGHAADSRGMVAKVAHLVRVIGQETELDCFVRTVRAEYHQLITTRIRRGEVLWAQFEAAVEACRADPKSDDRQITEKVNEMAVAKVLLDDQAITWPITYEPDLLPDGRKIDFIVDRGADNLYIEVKTVRPRTADTDAAWEKFLARRRRHPQNVQVHPREGLDGRRHLRQPIRVALALSRLRAGF